MDSKTFELLIEYLFENLENLFHINKRIYKNETNGKIKILRDICVHLVFKIGIVPIL